VVNVLRISMVKLAALTLVVGLLAGAFIGWLAWSAVGQPKISGLEERMLELNERISSLEAENKELKARISDLNVELVNSRLNLSEERDKVAALKARLVEAEDRAKKLGEDLLKVEGELEKLKGRLAKLNTTAFENALIQLGKDLTFLGKLREGLTVKAISLDQELRLWEEVRELSVNVDPALPSRVRTVMKRVEELSAWSSSHPGVNASKEELALWYSNGVRVLSAYLNDYREFEKAYLDAVQSHVEALLKLFER